MGRPSKNQSIDLSPRAGACRTFAAATSLSRRISRNWWASAGSVTLFMRTSVFRRCFPPDGKFAAVAASIRSGSPSGKADPRICRWTWTSKAAGISERTWFREGVQTPWLRLVEAARTNKVPENEIPAYPPEVVRMAEPGISFRAIRQAAKGRISLAPMDLQAMKVSVPIEYRPGGQPPGGPDVLELAHPGFETMAEFLLPQRPRNAAAQLLRKCLPEELRTDAFLIRLDPHFALE